MAFSEGVTNKRLVGKLETHKVETVAELFALADRCARESEAHARVECRGAPEESLASKPQKLSAKKNKRKVAAVLAAEGRPKPAAKGNAAGNGGGATLARHIDGKWCKIHRINRHDLTECRLVKDLASNRNKDRCDRCHDFNNFEDPSCTLLYL